MSAILNREPGTSAQSEENQVSTSTPTQQNVFTVQQIQPQAIFAGAHIDKFEGCTFNINVFCGDQSKIARLNENWFAERSRHKQALLTLQLHFWSLFINCCFNHKLFHWACMKNFCLHSLMKFVQKWDFEQLCISQIETSTSLPPPWRAYPGHVTPSPSREERIWLSESSRGWGIWTARSISCEISGMASSHRDRGVRGFSWKRLCLWGQLVTSFVPYLKIFEF